MCCVGDVSDGEARCHGMVDGFIYDRCGRHTLTLGCLLGAGFESGDGAEYVTCDGFEEAYYVD